MTENPPRPTAAQKAGALAADGLICYTLDYSPNYSMNPPRITDFSDEPTRRADELVRVLRRGSMGTDELLKVLGVSQPTLSRTIHEVPEAIMFRVPGVRTPRYGLVRRLPGDISGQQKVYRISAKGDIQQAGSVSLLAGGETYMQAGDRSQLYDGLPPTMAFASPSGFLGRQVARAAALDLRLPDNLRDWSDDDHAAFIIQRGWNLPGNLVYGDAALAQLLEARNAQPTPAAQKLAVYAAQTRDIRATAVGSSAGGEQPKFLALTHDHGHVIVKFAKADSRMGVLLRLEHLALESLAAAGLSSAPTRLLEDGDYTFLEVERFDRVGQYGRVGMLSAGALDDELFGKRDSWSAFAERCEDGRILNDSQAHRIHVMASYSELIGNTDRHFENISLMLDDRGDVSDVAPAYDLLPMKYAPLGGGVDPALDPIEPKLGAVGGRTQAWATAYEAARDFWTRVEQGAVPGIPPEISDLARRNLVVAREFVAPLVPSATAPAAPAAPPAPPAPPAPRRHRPKP